MTQNLLKIKYINLDRRPDRKETIEKELNKHNLIYERFPAVDGQTLKMTNELKLMFSNNTFSWRRSIVGCSLSHINLWKDLVNSNCQYYMVFEDDITLDPYFYKHYGKILYILSKTSVPDLILMGYTTNIPYINPHNPPTIGLEYYNDIYMYKINSTKYMWGGLFGYILNKNHAIKMLNLIDKHGISDPIDTFILKNTELLYMTSPDIVKTCLTNIDSDVNFDFLAIGDEYDFYECMDSYGEDLNWVSASTIEQIKNAADENSECVAFNTYGFLKKKICTPDKFIKFGTSKLCGIYIKRNHPLNQEYRNYILNQTK
jgi:GR25 family glycosyltransferase involved in LPS biosynthesis